MCEYDFCLGVPEACGVDLSFTKTVPETETWFMEISEVPGEGVVCTAQAAGFGLPTPVTSNYIADFSLGFHMLDREAKIVKHKARFGDRKAYAEKEVGVVEERILRPLVKELPRPNFLAITLSE